MDERIARIKELLADESFGEEIKDIETIEDMQAVFARHGVEMTLEEVKSVMVQAAVASGAELDEELLEDVAGGGILAGALMIGGAVVVSYAAGWVCGRILRNKTGMCR